MESSPLPPEPSALAIRDIYYILFRQKYKILLCSVVGLALAFLAHRFNPPPFQSEAKLFIRYVSDGKSPVFAGVSGAAKSPDQRGETILDSEMEIISSWDVAQNVALTLGPGTILGPDADPTNVNLAAGVIKANLEVEAAPRSSVIRLVFKHPNRDVVERVLPELISRYLRTHREIHRAVGMVPDFLSRETVAVRSRLAETEDELRKVRTQAGVISLEDTRKAYTEQAAAIRQQIFASQAELAERTSILQSAQQQRAATGRTVEPSQMTIPAQRLFEYRNASARLDGLLELERQLLTQFRDGNARVQEVRAQVADAALVKQRLEEEFPLLAGSALPKDETIETETARIAAIEAKIKVLGLQLSELRDEAAAIDQVEPALEELRRRKELEEANYRSYSIGLEQARIDEALGANRISNISQIQSPSPPVQDFVRASKLVAFLGGGGILLGLSWAFLVELFFDRTIKRRTDVERILHPPLFLSIPFLKESRSRRKAASILPPSTASLSESTNQVARLPASPLNPFHEALRDHVIGYFRTNGLSHKPKLIAVTGLGVGAGVSTIAAGLSRSLSETGEGNVLLVDMTTGRESSQQFIHGKAVCDLDQVLDARDPAQVAGNLYVVAEGTQRNQVSCNLTQRFSKLAPKLKASTFDYIIFDLPPVSPISITTRLAGFMDIVLLVVKSEKAEQTVFERATTLLTETKAPVGIVLNQTRAYVPSWLKQEFIGET